MFLSDATACIEGDAKCLIQVVLLSRCCRHTKTADFFRLYALCEGELVRLKDLLALKMSGRCIRHKYM